MYRLLILLVLVPLVAAGCGGTGQAEGSRRRTVEDSTVNVPGAGVEPGAVTLPPKRIATH